MRYRLLRYSLLVGATISAMFLGACGSEEGGGPVTVEETVVKTVPAGGVKTVTPQQKTVVETVPSRMETVTPPQQVTVVETEVVVETVTR